MTNDFRALLKTHGDTAQAWARRLPALIADPALTQADLLGLYEELEDQARAVARLVEEMEEADVSEHLLDAAHALEAMTADMAAAAARRMMELRGR